MLRVTNVCSKLAWVVSLKNKKSLTILNAFHKILNSSKGMQKKKKKKKKKKWVDKEVIFTIGQ